MRHLMLAACALMLVSLGCSVKQTKEQKAAATSSFGDAAVLEPLLLPAKPAEAKTIAQIREKANNGDEVTVTGIVPADAMKPFNETRAAFFLMDAADLASEEVQSEMECGGGENCPSCRALVDKLGLRVELVGPTGSTPVRTTVQGFKGIKSGSPITVKGKLEKDGGKLLIRATGFYVG